MTIPRKDSFVREVLGLEILEVTYRWNKVSCFDALPDLLSVRAGSVSSCPQQTSYGNVHPAWLQLDSFFA